MSASELDTSGNEFVFPSPPPVFDVAANSKGLQGLSGLMVKALYCMLPPATGVQESANKGCRFESCLGRFAWSCHSLCVLLVAAIAYPGAFQGPTCTGTRNPPCIVCPHGIDPAGIYLGRLVRGTWRILRFGVTERCSFAFRHTWPESPSTLAGRETSPLQVAAEIW